MSIILNWWGIAVLVVGSYLLVVAMLNTIFFLRLSRKPATRSGPRVSVLIPARNEEQTIGACLDGLLEQTYDNYKVVVLDDGSTDGTPQILETYERRDDRVRIIGGREKPDGWKGKTFAVQQLAEAADGEYLYMVDADTRHDPEAVSWAVSQLEERELDAFSAMATQTARTFADRLFVPTVYLPLIFVPVRLFNAPRLRSLSFGVGQFFMFRRSSFFRLGGMEPISAEITEDLALSMRLKRRGERYEILSSKGHVSGEMYGSLRESVKGFNKNLYDIASSAPVLAACLAPFILVLFALPTAALAATVVAAALVPAVAVSPFLVAGVAVFLVSCAINLCSHGQAAWTALLAPAFFAILAGLVYYALYRYRRGKRPVWKARTVDPADRSS